MAKYKDYVGLGRNCGNVCQVLHQRLKGKQLDELNEAVLETIRELTTWVMPAMRTLNNLLTDGSKSQIRGRDAEERQ